MKVPADDDFLYVKVPLHDFEKLVMAYRNRNKRNRTLPLKSRTQLNPESVIEVDIEEVLKRWSDCEANE